MGLIGNEKNFPRGGKKPVIAVPKKGSFSLFGKTSHKKGLPTKSSTNKKKKNQNKSPTSKLRLSRIESLSLKTLKEDMLILGRIQEIEEYRLIVALPGRLLGHVPITNVSTPYTNCLKDMVNGVNTAQTAPQLDEIFHVGQYVVARVVEMSHLSERKCKITLTLVPEAVQSDWSHTAVAKGSVIIAAVKSQEDNGYVMDTGIKNVRAFLKKSAAQAFEETRNQGKPLEIGHLLRCLVTKSDITSFASTVQLSADPSKVNNAVADDSEVSLDTVLPGTLLNAQISKVLHNGLEMNLGGQFVGCVYLDYLAEVWDVPQSYAEGDAHAARVLYVLPTVKFVHMTLNTHIFDLEETDLSASALNIGDVVKAEIKDIHGYGVVIRIKTMVNDVKGFVPIRFCSINDSISDPDMSYKEALLKKFQIGSKHKCRVLNYDYMAQQFICTLDKLMIKAKIFQKSDLQVAMKIKCQIVEHNQNGAHVTIGCAGKSFTGFVRSLHMGNVPLSHPEKKYPVGSLHQSRVLSLQGKCIQLTLKEALIKSDIPPITKFEDVKKGMECEGVVVLVTEAGALVTFYGDVKGWLPLEKDINQRNTFYIGQVVKCYAQRVDITNKKLSLKLKQMASTSEIGAEKQHTYEVGNAYKVTVTRVTDEILEVHSDSGSGIIPAQHLTDIPMLALLLLKTYIPGTVIESAFCFSATIPSILTLRQSLIDYFQLEGAGDLSFVHENMLLPCAVKSVTNSFVSLQLPLSMSSTTKVNLKDLCNFEVHDATQLGLIRHQGLIARVLKISQPRTYIRVTTKLSKCWDFDIEPCVRLLHNYWEDHDRIIETMKIQGNPLASLVPGECVKGEVVAVESSGVVIKLDCDVQGIATSMLCREHVEVGDVVEGTILFVDLEHNCVELVITPSVRCRINAVQDGRLADNLGVGDGVRGEVLSVHQEMIVVMLKGAGRQQLAYIPSRCHLNDIVPNLNHYKIGETSKMIVQSLEKGRIICVQQRFFSEVKKQKTRAIIAEIRKKKEVEKRILEEKSEIIDVNELSGVKSDEEGSEVGDIFEELTDSKQEKKGKKRRTSEGEAYEAEDSERSYKKNKKGSCDKITELEQLSRLSLTGGFVWDAKPSLLSSGAAVQQTDSSSEEEEHTDNKKEGKKKKLTRKERVAKARIEEEQLRAAEEKLADMDRGPQSADDFDRLVLSSPNNSEYWIKYMAFHLQATEIEKARAVAQRALSTISFREEQEKLNVWCALLNLENLYGSKESLDRVLEEAVQMNDPFKVYTQMLQIYADNGKIQEAEKLVSLLTKKFRDNKETWLYAGEVLLKLGRLESARSLMQKALVCLEKKLHVEIISKFAQLENRFGEPERAQTLMEHILTSYPKRTDIWSSYVDMLVKSGQLDAARQVLERGIAQKLPARKMKSLFSKFLQFEEHHGTPDGVKKVRQMAVDYVESTVGTKEED